MKKQFIGLFSCFLLIFAITPIAESFRNTLIIDTLNNTSSNMVGNWTEIQKLYAVDGILGNYFGCSVSISGTTALIGSESDEENGARSGLAYVFILNGTSWVQQAKLIPPDGSRGESFGCSVSLSGDTALIGAIGDNELGSASGSAYVFIRNGTTWIQQAKLIASDGAEVDYFGISVALNDDIAIIGAVRDYDTESGVAYVFIKSSGNQPSNKPTITGSSNGKIKVSVVYNLTTTDPDGDDTYFFIDGVGRYNYWLDWFRI